MHKDNIKLKNMASNTKEIWKQITELKGKITKNYGISNLGNLCSFEKSFNDKTIIQLADNNGFPVTTVRVNKKSLALFPHRQVANYFLKKPSAKYKYVLHLDHNKANNAVSNLKWATPEQQTEHNKHNPTVKNAISERLRTGAMAKKLNDAKVTKLKTELWNPKRKITLKQLANKYNIAEMNLYRIKSGLFWYHIHVEGEPITDKYKNFLKNVELGAKQAIKNKLELDKRVKLKDAQKKQKGLLKLKIKKDKALAKKEKTQLIAIKKAEQKKQVIKNKIERARKTKVKIALQKEAKIKKQNIAKEKAQVNKERALAIALKKAIQKKQKTKNKIIPTIKAKVKTALLKDAKIKKQKNSKEKKIAKSLKKGKKNNDTKKEKKATTTVIKTSKKNNKIESSKKKKKK